MLLNPRWRCHLMMMVALLLVFPVFSQTKKGFKQLNKEKWSAAIAAFALDTSDAELRPVALFGMAQALAALENPQKDYRQAMIFQEKASKGWKALKNTQRTELTKEYEVTLGTIDKLRSTAANNAWKATEKTTSLREVDEFLDVFPNSATYIKSKATKKQTELLAAGVRDAKSYADLSYLLNEHRDDLTLKYTSSVESIEQRTFEAFLAEKGVDQLDVFCRENPKHPVSRDAAKDKFPAAWKSESLTANLQFLSANPDSRFNQYIRKKAVKLLNDKPLSESEKARLSEEEKGWLAELQWEASGKSVNTSAPFKPSEREMWTMYIRRTAPSSGAFAALDKMYRYYAGNRDWTEAAKVLKENKPLFKNRQQWFDDMLALADGAMTGVVAVNIGSTVNTNGSEFSPVISADGMELYFCGRYRSDNLDGEDIFLTQKTDSGWSKPALVKELSFSGHQAPSSLTADGNRMLMFNNGKLFQTERTATGWSSPVAVQIDIARFPWVGLCQISSNNQVMLLEAKLANDGDHRLSDLYVALRDEYGNWGKPTKLDSVINTDESDRTPFLHPDLRTMYFSSQGHPGVGGLDVFKTTRLDDTWLHWSHPVNLGREVNTPGDDWGYKISTDGAVAWFATRSSGTQQDIFWITLPDSMRPEAVVTYQLDLKDDNGKPFDGKVIVKDPATDAVAGIFQANPTGGLTTITVPNDKPYSVQLQKDGYFPTSMPLPVQLPGKPLTISASIKPVSIEKMVATGKTAILNLLFDYDKDELKPESLPELKTVADIALKNNYKITLLGYTDNKGEPAYNKKLSQHRADAVKQALINLKVPSQRIVASGLGEDNPVDDNNTDEGRAKNRRVEIQFTKE